MTKYRNYKNKIEMFLASRKGRRLLNILYSWGAAIVIIGALFKLLHWSFGNEMLFIGMMTEFFVFFISGLEPPEEQYCWEQVYPELLSINPLDREEMEKRRIYLEQKTKEAKERAHSYSLKQESTSFSTDEKGLNSCEDFRATTKKELQKILPEDDIDKLSQSIENLQSATERLAKLGNLSAGTLEEWEKMASHAGDLDKEMTGYKEKMQKINSTMQSLHDLYESQLKDISGQVHSIDEINRRLDYIRRSYDESLSDTNAYQRENSEMLQKIRELNNVYARLLEAMTINMAGPGFSHRYNERYDNYRNTSDYHPERERYVKDYPSHPEQERRKNYPSDNRH